VRRAYLTLVAVCTGWGTIPLIVRKVDLPAGAIVFSRLSIAVLGLAAVLWWQRRRGDSGPALLSYRPGLCALAAAVLAVHWFAEFSAYRHAPVGTVLFIVYLAPVGIAAAAPLVLGEQLTARTVAAVALGAGGFALLAAPAVSSTGGTGLALAGLAAATFVALVLVSKPLADVYSGTRLALTEMAGASVLLAPVALMSRWGPPQWSWSWLVVLGLVHTAGGIALYLGALGRVPATHAGVLGYIEPFAAVVAAWWVLGERPTSATVAGGVLIVIAGIVLVLAAPAEVPISVPG
jgi:drug/metabolite transporter (DMT)-like permease